MKRHTNRRSALARSALLLGTLALGGGVQASDYPTTIQSLNPLAYWRLDETTASPAINTVANSGTLGSAGNGHIVLDVGKGEPGKVGSAARFVNNGNTVGYCGSKIDVPYNAAINPVAPFSVEFWAKPNSLGADGTGFCPLSCFDPNFYGGANRSGWLFYLNSAGQWQFRLGLTSGYATTLNATGGNATAGSWQHIVASYDGTTARIYVNGVLKNSSTPSAGWKPNPQMALRFGGTPLHGSLSDGPYVSNSGLSGNRGYDGWLDEVAIYPKALSPDTVAAHFNAASNPSTYGSVVLADQPTGYWNLDEPAVTAPDPASFPTVVNSGSVGADANGTVHWGAATAEPGTGGTAFGTGDKSVYFNGGSGYIEVADAPALHISGNITLLAWVKPQTKDFFRNILAHGWDSVYAETFLRISRGNGDIFPNAGYGDGNYYEVGVTDGTATYYDSALYPIPDGDIGNWVFIAGTYDGSRWNLYRNGTLVASTPSVNGALDVTSAWSIGSRSAPTEAEGLYFRGNINEPAIFDTALSASTIASLYQAAQLPPVITGKLKAPTEAVFKGSSVSFSVWAEGGQPLSYAWTSNGVPVSATGTNLTINNIGGGSKTIAVSVTNPHGTTTSSVTFDVVAAPPAFVKQPVSLARYSGFPFTLSVEVSGSTPLSYQWKLGTTPIPGATGPSYTAVASGATAGSYTVEVTNEAATKTSDPATVTVLSPAAGYATAVVNSGPVAFWRLGESSGTKAADLVGGHDGKYFSVTLGLTGSSAVDSDTAAGFTGLNSYVGLINGASDGTGISFSGHTNFTIEVYAKGAANQIDEATLVAKGTGSSGTTATEQFVLDVDGGKYRFMTRGAANTEYQAVSTAGPDGSWQHVVGVYNDTSGQLLIYVNGELTGSGATRPVGVRASAADVTIGSKHLGNDPAFDASFIGQIDDVAIYNFALSAEEIQAHYSATYGSTTAPFVTVPPKALTTYVGLPVTLKVSAAGSVPLTYQWKKGTTVLTIPGSDQPTLTIDPADVSDSGSYSVTIANAVGSVTTTPVAVSVLTPPTAPVAIPALVAHYTFDGNLADVTGRGNNGTAAGDRAISYVNDAAIGSGALHYFTDTNSLPTVHSAYVTLGLKPDLQFGTNDFSVAFWVRLPANYTGPDLPYICNAENSANNPGYTFAPSYGTSVAGSWGWSVFDTASTGVNVYGPVGALIEEWKWYHLVHSFDRKGVANTYLNGRLVDSRSITTIQSVDTGKPTSIGQDPTGQYPEGAEGEIDDLGFFKKALTAFEAQSIYVAGAVNRLSFTLKADPTISITKAGATTTITYAGVLQASETVNGTYTDVSAATSPYTVNATGAAKFYRARSE